MPDSSIGEYAMKAVKAGTTILEMKRFLASDAESLTLTREQVDAVMMTIREQVQAIKQLRTGRGVG